MKIMQGWIRATAMVCGAAMLGGCYTYAPVHVAQVSIGSEVRAHVTQEEADRVESVLGRRTTTLEGRVLERDPNGRLLLRVPAQLFSTVGQTRRYYQRLMLTPADVLDLQMRKLNVARTVGLVALGVAAVVLSATVALNGKAGGVLPGGGSATQHDVVTPIH